MFFEPGDSLENDRPKKTLFFSNLTLRLLSNAKAIIINPTEHPRVENTPNNSICGLRQ
jgi:hypothetical protein